MLDAPAIHERIAKVASACVELARSQHSSPIAPDVAHLSALFTGDRGGRSRTYMREPALRRAYLAFWVPHNVARLAGVLMRAVDEGHIDAAGPVRVLDLGAGPLSGVLAAWCVFSRVDAATAVDLSRQALVAGLDVLERVGAEVGDVVVHDAPVNGPPSLWWPKAPVSLVVLANVLNELSDPRRPDQRRRVVDTALKALAPGGRLLITEPAMRVEARSLMSVRDELIADDVPVLSPCVGARECPLLKTRGDWCHQDVRWENRPANYRALEVVAGLPKAQLAVSHLLVARPDDDVHVTAPGRLRVVGGVMRDNRGTERRYLCGDDLVTIEGRPRLPPNVSRPIRGDLVDVAATSGLTPAPHGRSSRSARADAAPMPLPTTKPKKKPARIRR